MKRVTYSNALNAQNPPSSSSDGVELEGKVRLYAECLSVTVSSGTAPIKVTLHATKRGARALLDTTTSANFTGGDVRWWVRDPVSGEWHAGVTVMVPTNVQRAVTPDEFVTVFGDCE
jgi:hypothetical protein